MWSLLKNNFPLINSPVNYIEIYIFDLSIEKYPGGEIGRHVRLRGVCRKVCRFKSCSGYLMKSKSFWLSFIFIYKIPKKILLELVILVNRFYSTIFFSSYLLRLHLNMYLTVEVNKSLIPYIHVKLNCTFISKLKKPYETNPTYIRYDINFISIVCLYYQNDWKRKLRSGHWKIGQ